jgi:ribosome-associated protein
VEAVFDVEASRALDQRQREMLLDRGGALITAVAQDARGQARNRELALRRLAERIAAGLDEPVRRRPTRPTRASRMKRLEEKRRAGKRKRTRRPPSGDY